MIREWLLRKLGTRRFIQSATITTDPESRKEALVQLEVKWQKANMLRKLIAALEQSGALEWIDVPTPNGIVLGLSLRVV